MSDAINDSGILMTMTREVATSTAVEDRRSTTRTARQLPIILKSRGMERDVRCLTDDICEAGMFLRVPASVGFCVGKRIEIVFTADEPFAGGESCFATVVRTSLLSHDEDPMVGAGLRFDHPLYF